MTSFVLHHYDASRSPLLVTSFPPIVILNGGKHAVWEKQGTGWWHRVKNLWLWWHLTVFPTTVIDPSHPFRMTSFVLHHYDASRSPLLVTSFPPIVILNGGKHAVWEKQGTGWWHRVKNLWLWWHLTVFPTTVIDPSHPFRMTINVSLIMKTYRLRSFWTEANMPYEKNRKRDSDTERRIYYADDALPLFLITVIDPSHLFRMTINVSLIMKTYRLRSFWTEARTSCGKDGKRNDETEWRIYYPGWRLTFPSLQQQILCCCFVWHLMEIICFGF